MSPTLLFLAVAAGAGGSAPIDPAEAYPYGSDYFSKFVDDSFQSESGARTFYSWLDKKLPNVWKIPGHAPSLEQYLDQEKKTIAAAPTNKIRAKQERRLAIWLHRMVKKTMPNFNLDTGFEFRNAVAKGQRQCFLQSVIIAGCLQRAGVNAGVTMVNRNIQGQETNNKHAICLARLSDGADVIVDASEDYAFAKQQGLFLNSADGYKFVKPVYKGDFEITSYQGYGSGNTLPLATVRPMPRNFVTSQFDYYRGERTVGGVMFKQKTTAGLEEAANYLAKSVSEDPHNSLSQYMLGRVYLYRNEKEPASISLDRAMKLYDAQGWVPPDERMAQATAHKYS